MSFNIFIRLESGQVQEVVVMGDNNSAREGGSSISTNVLLSDVFSEEGEKMLSMVR
jgi:hypothetical protein